MCVGWIAQVLAPACVAAWLQGGTGIYVLTTTYLAGLLPAALGDWSNIVGALCYIPLVGTAYLYRCM